MTLGCLAFLAAGCGAARAGAQDFWAHWSDGKAELNGYRLVQPRYGAPREGTAVLIYVTEPMLDAARVKAESARHAPADVYPVMKLNAVREFQTGVYDYDVMTSVFARALPGWPLAKASFSSQEWCGQVYHQILPRNGRVEGTFHSYFEAEADGRDDLPHPEGGVFEDALPILVRGWLSAYLAPGESRSVPFLPSLLRARLQHRPLAWGRARISRSAAPASVTVEAGRFSVATWTVAEEGGPTTTYDVEAEAPYRLVRWAVDDGEQGRLLASTRLAYWKLNAPGGERHLRELGLGRP